MFFNPLFIIKFNPEEAFSHIAMCESLHTTSMSKYIEEFFSSNVNHEPKDPSFPFGFHNYSVFIPVLRRSTVRESALTEGHNTVINKLNEIQLPNTSNHAYSKHLLDSRPKLSAVDGEECFCVVCKNNTTLRHVIRSSNTRDINR